MSNPIRVVPSQLQTAAIRVDQHAEDVLAGHHAAATRVEVAQASWPSASAAALSAKAAKWLGVSAVLHARLADHGAAFRDSGHAYEQAETANADAVAKVGVDVPEA